MKFIFIFIFLYFKIIFINALKCSEEILKLPNYNKNIFCCVNSSDCPNFEHCLITGKNIGLCIPETKGKGATCKGNLECSGALNCNYGHCGNRIYKNIGDPCSSFMECGSAYCNNGKCESTKKGEGECDQDSDCGINGKCCNKKCSTDSLKRCL
jgi:hypothetical protein